MARIRNANLGCVLEWARANAKSVPKVHKVLARRNTKYAGSRAPLPDQDMAQEIVDLFDALAECSRILQEVSFIQKDISSVKESVKDFGEKYPRFKP